MANGDGLTFAATAAASAIIGAIAVRSLFGGGDDGDSPFSRVPVPMGPPEEGRDQPEEDKGAKKPPGRTPLNILIERTVVAGQGGDNGGGGSGGGGDGKTRVSGMAGVISGSVADTPNPAEEGEDPGHADQPDLESNRPVPSFDGSGGGGGTTDQQGDNPDPGDTMAGIISGSQADTPESPAQSGEDPAHAPQPDLQSSMPIATFSGGGGSTDEQGESTDPADEMPGGGGGSTFLTSF